MTRVKNSLSLQTQVQGVQISLELSPEGWDSGGSSKGRAACSMNGPMQGDTRSAMMRNASVWVSSSAWNCMVRVGKNKKARGARGVRGENETFFQGKSIFIDYEL